MDLALETAKSGSTTCRRGSHYLHSSYNPAAEALRFLDSSMAGREGGVFLLSGPCLGYLPRLIRERFPDALLLSLQLSPWFKGKDTLPPESTWYPGGEEGIQSFLERHLEEELCSSLTYLEWPPAVQAFPEEAESLRKELTVFLERLAASAATTKSAGRRWILNACRGFLLAEELLRARPEETPIVLAAAGPSLEEAAEALAAERSGFRLIAVSSALAALRERGLEPDLLVATDGGPWSRHHLYPLAAAPLPLASPLAALPSASLAAPLLLLDQRFFPETELCAALGGGISLPSHGTVAGSALALAALLGKGPLVVAGLDLAARGQRSHASPHGFDSLLQAGSGRLEPLEARLWAREGEAHPELIGEGPWRSSRSLQVYAHALERDAEALRGRLFRLSPSPLRLEGFLPLDAAGFRALLKGTKASHPDWPLSLAPPREKREALLRASIEGWMRGARLAALGLAAGKLPDPSLVDLFRAIDYPDWAAARRAGRFGKDPSPAVKALETATLGFLEELRQRLLP